LITYTDPSNCYRAMLRRAWWCHSISSSACLSVCMSATFRYIVLTQVGIFRK